MDINYSLPHIEIVVNTIPCKKYSKIYKAYLKRRGKLYILLLNVLHIANTSNSLIINISI